MDEVSVLFNEPKLLKCRSASNATSVPRRFSALQRAEIAEMHGSLLRWRRSGAGFSALQRAEIAEIHAHSIVVFLIR